MAKFITTSGISYQIENIIRNTKDTLYLISPYLKLTNNFQSRLEDVDQRGVSIILVYGKDQLTKEQKSQLLKLQHLQLFYQQNLHAKCYANEEEMVITSMNMYEFSEKNNREMGVFINKQLDKSIYEEAFEEIKSILRSASKEYFGKKLQQSQANSVNDSKGFCIRCDGLIKFNTSYPLCSECFEIWNIWQNATWEENYCHLCGKEAITCKDKPLCHDCFNHQISI